MEYFSNPLVGIVVSQILVIWSLVLGHWGYIKATKIFTLIAAIPLTLIAIIISYSTATNSEADKIKNQTTIDRIQEKTIEAEQRLDKLNEQLKQMSSSLSNIDTIQTRVSDLFQKTDEVKNNIIQLNEKLLEVHSDFQTISSKQLEMSKSVDQNISAFNLQMNRSLSNINNSSSNAAETLEIMLEEERKYRDCLARQRENLRLNPRGNVIMAPCR